MGSPTERNNDSYSEQEIIARLKQKFSSPGSTVLTGIGDDAAVLRLPNGDACQVVTTDLLVEDIHFSRSYMSAADIGFKAVAVNLSDIAAMGAAPVAAFGCLGIPPGFSKRESDGLIDGVAEACSNAGCALAGGDTVAAPQLIVGFTVIGTVTGRPMLRSGAAPGDEIWHSGELGLSEAGRRLLAAGSDCPKLLADAHRRPLPQLELGRWLQGSDKATSCIDLSDSLSECLIQLADASGCGLEIDLRDYAFHPDLLANIETGPAAFVLGAAEDYQLLFTVSPGDSRQLAEAAPVPVSRLGQIREDADERRVIEPDAGRIELAATGWQHPLAGKDC